MHLRKLVLACGFASFALSNYASALGLGEIKLKSTLNQPLSAEVQLLDTKGLTSEQIIVALASAVDFDRNGLDYVHFYSELKFDVSLDSPGGPVVRITSRNPVREPYLNFLIEAKWTSGRLLREYTLLMDLPTFDDATPKTVQSAQAAPSKPAASTKRTETTSSSPVTPSASTATSEEKPDIIAEQDQAGKKSKVASGTYGPVGAKDTLWDIALAVRPDSGTSVHQTMMALQRLNPDAFIHGNVNLLKKGQVLRVPDASEMTSISQSEAVRQFNDQAANWSGGASAGNTNLGAQLDASHRTAGEQTKAEAVAGRVKLEAPSAKDRAANGQGSGANKGSGKALESDLAATLEELDKAKSEKTELSSRVRDLEDQVKTMQRLVDVSNEKLRSLQLNSAKQPEKAGTEQPSAKSSLGAQAGAASSAAMVISSAVAVAPVIASDPVSSVKAETTSSAPAVAPVRNAVTNPTPQVEREKSILDKVMDNIVYVVIGAAAILAAIAIAVMRRRKSLAEDKDNSDPDGFLTHEPNFDSFNQPHSEESDIGAHADEISLSDEETTTTVAETGDVVGEADIYIAYGKFDQAEEMLLNGLAKDPGSVDIRLKLMEIYSHTKNLNGFDKHYAAILPLATGFALSRASELRANIPEAGEFIPETSDSNNDSGSAEEFDLNDNELAVEKVSALPQDDDLAFDLDLDDNGELNSDLEGISEYDTGLQISPSAHHDVDFASLDDDFNLDFGLDESRSIHKVSDAEDLSDISLALDTLDEDKLPKDIETSATDDFSFDFDDLEDEPGSLAHDARDIALPKLNEDVSSGDDFNLDMDVNSVDMAALDSEMADLDAELDGVNDERADKLVFDASEFNVDNLNGESLADLNSSLETKAGEAKADFSEHSWDELDLETDADITPAPADAQAQEDVATESHYTVPTHFAETEDFETVDGHLETDELAEADDIEDDLILEEDLFVEDDDFDLDAPSNVLGENELYDLDADLAEDDALDLEDDVDVNEHHANVESTTFAELEAEFAVNLSEESDDAHGHDSGELLHVENPPLLEDDKIEDHFVSEEKARAVDETNSADDDLFEQALSDFSSENLVMDETSDMSDDDMDAELDFMADADEAATKLDLARAYMDMGDSEGARDILSEVAHEGNEQQRQEAVDLLGRIDA